jgi:MEMO1 family protein
MISLLRKHRTYNLVAICVFFVLCVLLVLFFRNRAYPFEVSSAVSYASKFYDELLFQKGISKNSAIQNGLTYHISVGIVPHYAPASEYLSEFYKQVSFQKPKTIILIGPNHYEVGNAPVITTGKYWDSPYGVVRSNTEIIKKFTQTEFVKIDESVFENEHSIGTLIPYIAYYTPGTTVVPIILSSRMSFQSIMDFSKILSEIDTRDTVILASIDFSHYLPSLDAQKRDEVTLQAMKQFGYQDIFRMNSEYVDSPSSLITTLRVAELHGFTKMEVLHHSDSGIEQHNATIPTTSYYTIAFHE